jgi:hypothetical protein
MDTRAQSVDPKQTEVAQNAVAIIVEESEKLPAPVYHTAFGCPGSLSQIHFKLSFSKFPRRAPANATRCSATRFAASKYAGVIVYGPGPGPMGPTYT